MRYARLPPKSGESKQSRIAGNHHMPTLVTGGTGFLGCYVLESLLKTGEEVVCLSNTTLAAVARPRGARDDRGRHR